MPLKAAVISLGSKSSKWTVKAMKNYFRTVDDLDIRDVEVILGPKEAKVLYQGKPLEKSRGFSLPHGRWRSRDSASF